MIHYNFPQVMGCQMNSELLNKILEEDIISLRGGESDHDLLGFDLEKNLENNCPPLKLYSIIDELMDNPQTNHNKNQPYTKTIMSTIFSDISHSLNGTTTTTEHSILDSAIPVLTASHHDTRQNNINPYTNYHRNK